MTSPVYVQLSRIEYAGSEALVVTEKTETLSIYSTRSLALKWVALGVTAVCIILCTIPLMLLGAQYSENRNSTEPRPIWAFALLTCCAFVQLVISLVQLLFITRTNLGNLNRQLAFSLALAGISLNIFTVDGTFWLAIKSYSDLADICLHYLLYIAVSLQSLLAGGFFIVSRRVAEVTDSEVIPLYQKPSGA